METKINVNRAWFVHWHHDLYAGLTYFGPFNTKDEADNWTKENARFLKSADVWNVVELPYVVWEEKVIALWEEAFCRGKMNVPMK